jgi:DNA-binding NtrC family response regulator
MKIDAKKLRVLFIDDEELEITHALKSEGYDIEHWRDVDNLDGLCDGRYHVIFLDVRGIGGKYGGNGLNVLKYIATHNPLIYTCIFSAKPFTGEEAETIRQYAGRAITKDCSTYDLIEILETYAATLSADKVTELLDNKLGLSWFDRWKLKRGQQLSQSRLARLSKASKAGADAIKVAANMTSAAMSLYKIINGIGP